MQEPAIAEAAFQLGCAIGELSGLLTKAASDNVREAQAAKKIKVADALPKLERMIHCIDELGLSPESRGEMVELVDEFDRKLGEYGEKEEPTGQIVDRMKRRMTKPFRARAKLGKPEMRELHRKLGLWKDRVSIALKK